MYIFQHLRNDKDRRGGSLLSAMVEASVLHLLMLNSVELNI